MKDGKRLAADYFSQLVGKKARNVQLGYGSFITIDFGKDLLVEVKTKKGIDTFNRGEWHLWVYMAAWRLDQGDRVLIGAGDDREEIAKELTTLEGKQFVRAIILNTSFDTVLEFQDDVKLNLFSFKTKESDQWMLFMPDRKVFTAGPGNTWTYEVE